MTTAFDSAIGDRVQTFRAFDEAFAEDRPSRVRYLQQNRRSNLSSTLTGTPAHPDTWLRLRLYPIAKKLGVPFHPTFQVLRRSFSTHGTKEAHPTEMQAQLGHSDPRMTLNTYTRTLGPEVIQMVNQVTNRILGLAEKGEEAVQ